MNKEKMLKDIEEIKKSIENDEITEFIFSGFTKDHEISSCVFAEPVRAMGLTQFLRESIKQGSMENK